MGILGGLFLSWMGGAMIWGSARHRSKLPQDGIYRTLLLACGLFLVYTGLRFIWAGVGFAAGQTAGFSQYVTLMRQVTISTLGGSR